MKARDIPNLKRLLRTLRFRHKDSIRVGPCVRTIEGTRGYHEKSYAGMVARKIMVSLERAIEELERRKA